jgi:hypothetical protein
MAEARILMFKRMCALAAVAVSVSAPVAQAQMDIPTPLPTSCPEMYTPSDYKSYAEKVYDRSTVSAPAHRRMRRMYNCAASDVHREVIKKVHHRLKKARELRQRQAHEQARVANVLLPYAGPNGTRWAIPWPIVACESGGDWYAHNPSGASGPYQLLGWGAPYPAVTEAQKMENHRIAARVWNGGRGAFNWVCKG